MDDSFEDVSRIGKYADILATTSDTKTPILIELKDYSGTVPSEEVEKFWRDIERRGTRYGIFVSMRSGISKCSSCISVKTEMNKTGIFVNNSELNWSGHLFAYYVTRKIAELETMKKRELKSGEITRIITRVNNQIQELSKNVESIDNIEAIADTLRTTCKNKLDELINFSNALKRTMNEKITDILEDMKKVEI
jgi:molecular chaperone DnaK (HSP70)